MKRSLITFAAIIVGSAAVLPTQAVAQVSLGIVIGNAPPPIRYEVVPGPRKDYEWAPGYWNWNGHQHVWLGGHWERARPGYHYQHSEWSPGRGGWQLDRGGWRGGAPQHMGPGSQQHDDHHGGPERHYGPDHNDHDRH